MVRVGYRAAFFTAEECVSSRCDRWESGSSVGVD